MPVADLEADLEDLAESLVGLVALLLQLSPESAQIHAPTPHSCQVLQGKEVASSPQTLLAPQVYLRGREACPDRPLAVQQKYACKLAAPS